MINKVKLSVLGFSFNQNRTGAYGLVLAEENGLRRLMVIVGTPEAQSIAFELQGSTPPRPLTHDLICNIFTYYSIDLIEVNIYKYSDGVFFSRLILKQGDNITEIESRTSDAVGIALRTGSPIYTTEDIMQELSVVFDEANAKRSQEGSKDTIDSYMGFAKPEDQDYSSLSKSELEKLLDEAVAKENYELASIIRDALNNKDN
ncbi:bifunctional nuclease family protein [Dysgonomonas massiliensis]|uniref:bifunctional nuclease family protein n=1 Tax=Dysgonomonas massiliensis TaxID=2040292 RepID=UPI000C78F4E7|nr:bifunctional nuclease family protein [Dysgonomonas massiliensis]